MNEVAIKVESVAKRFGSQTVLKALTLEVPRGQIYALLGRNGAGKTTTINLLLGLLKSDGGNIDVLGLEPQRDALKIRRRVGYLAEDQVMFGWMRISEIIAFIAPFYPTWDTGLASQYLKRFELPPERRVKDLSIGQKCRLGLLLALAHRPELVILDDPTLGLDPIMRKEFMRDVIEHLQGRGVTVFFSSHLLYEIEPVADEVAILDGGRIVRSGPTEQLRKEVKRLVMPSTAYESLGELPQVLDVRRRNGRVAVTVENAEAALDVARTAKTVPEVVDLNLDEIFEAYVIGRRSERDDPQLVVERVD